MTLTLTRTGRPLTAVRPLMFRQSWYVVPTTTLSALLAARIVREQVPHSVTETVKWTLAMYNVTPVAGGAAPRPIDEIGGHIDDLIEAEIGDRDIDMKVAVEAVHKTLARIFGHQLRVTGFLPGHRVMTEGRRMVLELSGDTCPSCTINPTGYRVGDRHNTARCLNSEDCGWTSA